MPAAVGHYRPPQTAANWFIMAFSAGTMLVFARRANFHPTPDSALYPLKASFPSAFEVCSNIQPWVFNLAVGIHGFESFLFSQLKLRKHGVQAFTLVWWQWMISVFIEGLPAFSRIEEAATKTK